MLLARTEVMGRAAVEIVASTTAAEGTAVAELTRRMAAGEEESFREFYDFYSRRLFGYLFVLSRGDEGEAKELLQQTMIKVARYVRVFEDEEIFWKWLKRVARSSWLDENRKANRYLSALERFWKGAETEAGEAEESAAARELEISLEALTEEERTLLRRKYVEGHSLREMAELMGSSEKAVESRLTRARNRLKEIFNARRKS